MEKFMRSLRDLFHALDHVPVWPPHAFAAYMRNEFAKMGNGTP